MVHGFTALKGCGQDEKVGGQTEFTTQQNIVYFNHQTSFDLGHLRILFIGKSNELDARGLGSIELKMLFPDHAEIPVQDMDANIIIHLFECQGVFYGNGAPDITAPSSIVFRINAIDHDDIRDVFAVVLLDPLLKLKLGDHTKIISIEELTFRFHLLHTGRYDDGGYLQRLG